MTDINAVIERLEQHREGLLNWISLGLTPNGHACGQVIGIDLALSYLREEQ